MTYDEMTELQASWGWEHAWVEDITAWINSRHWSDDRKMGAWMGLLIITMDSAEPLSHVRLTPMLERCLREAAEAELDRYVKGCPRPMRVRRTIRSFFASIWRRICHGLNYDQQTIREEMKAEGIVGDWKDEAEEHSRIMAVIENDDDVWFGDLER